MTGLHYFLLAAAALFIFALLICAAMAASRYRRERDFFKACNRNLATKFDEQERDIYTLREALTNAYLEVVEAERVLLSLRKN